MALPPQPSPLPPAGTGAEPFHENLPRQLLALAAWAGLWLALEALFRRSGLDDRQQLAAQLGILAAGGVALALAAAQPLARLLTSVRFAVAQGVLLVGATLVAALAAAPGQAPGAGAPWPAQHPCDRLWFSALLALLAVSALAVTWKRRPFNLTRMGFLLVHLAPSVVLLGALWGRFEGVRARVRLEPGAAVDQLIPAPGRKPFRLPGFSLRLEPAAGAGGPRLYAFTPGAPAAPVLPVGEAGATLAAGRFRVDLAQALPDAVETGQIAENPAAPANPALQVVLGLGLEAPLVGNLFARDPVRSRQDEPGGGFAVVFRETWDDSLPAALGPAPPRDETLELASGGRTLRHSGKAGEDWKLPGFTLKVIRIYPDFAVRPGSDGGPEAYSRSEVPREPWAQLDLVPDSGPVRRLLLSARHPALSDQLNAPNLPAGTTLHYLRTGEEAQRRFVLFTRNDQRVRLLEDGRVVRGEPLVLGRPFIVEPGRSVTASALLERAEPVFAPNPGPAQGAGHPVLRARVSEPGSGAAEERWLEPGTEPAWFLGGRVGLGFREPPPGAGAPWPELLLLDPLGHELARKALAPGEDLRLRGFRILALAPAPDDPWGFQVEVAREPGLGLMAAGCACLLLGSAWMFYLKPVLKRREARP